jgi:hypothetical protein
MCSYITQKAEIFGSAKGPSGWFDVDTAQVYFDHPYHAQLEHSLNIDFINQAGGAPTRMAVEMSAESAKKLVASILAALEAGEREHLMPLEPART